MRKPLSYTIAALAAVIVAGLSVGCQNKDEGPTAPHVDVIKVQARLYDGDAKIGLVGTARLSADDLYSTETLMTDPNGETLPADLWTSQRPKTLIVHARVIGYEAVDDVYPTIEKKDPITGGPIYYVSVPMRRNLGPVAEGKAGR